MERERRERGLDETIAETFPCSDPLSSIPDPLYSFDAADAIEPHQAVGETHPNPEKIQNAPASAPRRKAS